MKNSYTPLQKNMKDKGPEQTFFFPKEVLL